MHRGPTGRLVTTAVEGEMIQAFVPHALPPDPPLRLDGPLPSLFEQALLALGRMDAIAPSLPDPALLLYTYVRKEAVLSSQIEGTRSTLSDFLLFEITEMPGMPVDDVQEISLYVAALNEGLDQVRGGHSVSGALLRRIHSFLLAGGRGSDKRPGKYRRSQNWIGGTRPGNAVFVPPPPAHVVPRMGELEDFLLDTTNQVPGLIKAALAHVQFETIHPFLDGNGRVGRLMISILLCAEGILLQPLLYLSLYFKQHRAEYYRLLSEVREKGDWEAWLAFFLVGVRETADNAVATAGRVVALFEENRGRIESLGRAAGSGLQVHEALTRRPILSQPHIATMTGLVPTTVAKTMAQLVELGIVRELTNRKRNKLFGYSRYIEILSEGTEPLA